MEKDSLGDRMKSYECAFDICLPIRIPMMIRIDGKSFHSMVKKWKCEKPFDRRLQQAMSYTAMELCKNIQGARFAYIQSDEISIVAFDDMTNQTQAWFDKRLSKITSIAASIATSAFNSFALKQSIEDDGCFAWINIKPNPSFLNVVEHPAMFDARAWIMPEYEVMNNLIWRQQDASRNSVQMLARSLYSHKQVTNHCNSELQEMCFQAGHNWNDLETWQKRGWCIVQKEVEFENQHGKFVRNKWIEDMDIPIFTGESRTYLHKNLIRAKN